MAEKVKRCLGKTKSRMKETSKRETIKGNKLKRAEETVERTISKQNRKKE